MTPLAGTARRLTIADYYRLPVVRKRIREYCGGVNGDLTCVFLSAVMPGTQASWAEASPHRPADLELLLDAGADISRSMWDSKNLIVHLDLDYQHSDRPGEPFEHPADAFVKLEPTRRAIQQLLDRLGLPLLVVMTGRGYHFSGRIPLEDPLIGTLAQQASTPAWLVTHPQRRPPWAVANISETSARAYSSLGLLVEHFAHEAIRLAMLRSRIPVVVNGTVVGRGPGGRECASLDFSYAGDPLDMRHMRVAFSAYQTHPVPVAAGESATSALPALIAVPVGSRSLLDLLDSGREPASAVALAAETSAAIPVVTRGVSNLLDSYQQSPLAGFHKEFYAIAPDPPWRWSMTYDRLDTASLLPCVGAPLATPNDLLLKPEYLQHVTRYLMSRGWHPRHVAGLVHSRYTRDFHWGDRWTHLDAETRAEFDVRVFAGMVVTGLDRGVDFNCRSAQEKGLCPGAPCTHDLRSDCDRLLARVGQ